MKRSRRARLQRVANALWWMLTGVGFVSLLAALGYAYGTSNQHPYTQGELLQKAQPARTRANTSSSNKRSEK
jgi:hypothetical protein